MKKIGRISLYIILGSFIFIQFFRVELNTSAEVPEHDLLLVHPDMATDLQQTFRTSCYDCHSDNTDYPWYAHIAPFSWVIDQHIRNGKHEVNYNGYDTLGKRKKIALLDEICEVVSDSSMPPANYLMLHPEAVLSEEDIAAICEWTEMEALKLLRRK
jgi:hypothetical protein